MTPADVKKFYKTCYRFREKTGMSAGSLGNWIKWGFVPLMSQVKLQKLTNGELKATWNDENIPKE